MFTVAKPAWTSTEICPKLTALFEKPAQQFVHPTASHKKNLHILNEIYWILLELSTIWTAACHYSLQSLKNDGYMWIQDNFPNR